MPIICQFPYAMKRTFALALFMLFSVALSAQIQSGYVRTIGRPGKPGKPIANVTIRMKGGPNAVVSGKDGSFNVRFTNKKDGDGISLVSVSKKGYILNDKDIIGRQLVFSSRVPIVITMVDTKQLEEDKRRIEKNAYKTAERNYKKKVDEINKQIKKKKITEDKYRQQLSELQSKYENYLLLVEDMADRYARTDYDQLDSLDKVINVCIENGELEKADSLIHTVFDPETVLERNHNAKKEIQQRIAFAQSVIDKAMVDRENILHDLEYAKHIAELCFNLGNEYLLQENSSRALECFQRALDLCNVLYGETSEEVNLIKQRIEELQP